MKRTRIIIALLMVLMMAVLTCCAQPAGSGEGTADSGSAAESEAAQEQAAGAMCSWTDIRTIPNGWR